MAKRVFSFKASETDAEVEFINREVKRTNTNISTVIKQLIRNAMDEKKLEDQTEMLKSELGEIKKFTKQAAECATFAKYMATANYDELAQSNPKKVEEMKKAVEKLTKKGMDEIQ